MDSVHFLNIEYILLRLNDIFSNVFAWITGTPPELVQSEGIASPKVASHLFEVVTFTTGQLALLGTALAIIFLAAAVWIRIKLEVMEHEGFHAREAKYHPHDAHGAHEGGHEHSEELVKNARWEEVTRLANSTSESDWRRAIMEADIMLGEALETQGYRGNTVGEKLKDANPLQMTTLDIAWQAHKVRNDIAHGGEGYHLSEWDTKGTIDFYRRIFEELGFI
ncbi:MAG: hypothetical protein V4436_03605 [Patescibacteria group bacterium]